MTRTEERESRSNAGDVDVFPHSTGHSAKTVCAGEKLEVPYSHTYQDHHRQPTDDELCDLSETAPDILRTALPDEAPFSPFNQEQYTGRDLPPFLYPHPRGAPEVVEAEALCGGLLVGAVRSTPPGRNQV